MVRLCLSSLLFIFASHFILSKINVGISMNCVLLCIYVEREIVVIFVKFLNFVVFIYIFQSVCF